MHNEVSRWLRDWAFPRLIAVGLDRVHGGYVERFSWAGQPVDPGFKRVRVTARQIYAFSHAALGGVHGAEEAAQHGVNFLLSKALTEDGSFVSRLHSDGAVMDPTADLYDLAFVLFALAWWYKVSGDETIIDVAERSLSAARRLLKHPYGQGFLHRAETNVSSQQNPHMHLFEAAIFLSAFTGRESFRILLQELFQLTSDRLYDPVTGTLAEYFTHDWSRPQPNSIVSVEPGHQFEWCWLLARYHGMTGDENSLLIARDLFDFADRHGFDTQTGLIFDEVNALGDVTKTDFRIWPNLEYVKALVAMQEIYPENPRFDDIVLEQAISRVFRYFLPSHGVEPGSAIDGFWIDYLSGADYLPKVDHIPASTFYHLTFAFTEVTRHRAKHSAFSGLPW